MLDLALHWIVIILPFLFAVGIELIDENMRKRSRSWRFAVIGFGIAVSAATWWQLAREQTKAQSEERDLREQITQQKQDSDGRFNEINNTVRGLFSQIASQRRLIIPNFPTAEEIASAVQRLNVERQPISKPTAENLMPPVKPLTVLPVIPTVKIPPPCRGDRLNECNDEQVLAWGGPLVSNVETIMNDYSADLKKLDDIKGGKANWLRELAGVGDKNSKWLNAYDLAEKKAADKFRDCCAEKALAYHNELVRRTGGKESRELYEWVQALISPTKSREWKKARESGGKVSEVYFDLDIMQINLNSNVVKQHLGLPQ